MSDGEGVGSEDGVEGGRHPAAGMASSNLTSRAPGRTWALGRPEGGSWANVGVQRMERRLVSWWVTLA